MDDADALLALLVHHLRPVREVEALQDLDHDAERQLDRQRDALPRAATKELAEVEALDVLHRDVQRVVLAPQLLDADDVRVLEARRELRLLREQRRQALGASVCMAARRSAPASSGSTSFTTTWRTTPSSPSRRAR